jgi:hypothetical protein
MYASKPKNSAFDAMHSFSRHYTVKVFKRKFSNQIDYAFICYLLGEIEYVHGRKENYKPS